MNDLEKEASQFIGVDIQIFRDATRDITFDLYIKLSENNYAHVFSRNTGMDYKRLAQYIQKGVTELFVRKEDKEVFEKFRSVRAEDSLMDPNTPEPKKIALLLNMTEQAISELFAHIRIPEATATSTKKVVKSYVDLMSDHPKSMTLILKLASHGDYLYYHSMATAVFSILLARATGNFNRRMLEALGLGGFLHDIGQVQLPREITEHGDELTPAQWKDVRNHTKIGLKMIENTANIPDEVKFIVYQHHEEPSGNGYPNGLRGNAIYYPAKIVALADGFSALISKRPFREAYSVEQAIHIIQSVSGKKYDPELVEILSQLFRKPSMAQAA